MNTKELLFENKDDKIKKYNSIYYRISVSTCTQTIH